MPFQCDRCKKAGLTIDECVECMRGHMNSEQECIQICHDWATIEPRVINRSEFVIQNRDLDDDFLRTVGCPVSSAGVQRILTWTWFDTILDATSYTETLSGCESPQTLSNWLETNRARQGYKEFKFDLESAKNPFTNPSMQYGMTHGFVLLLNDCTVQQPYNRRFPPVLLRFFRYRRYGINLGFTIKIMGNKSEIKWLKTIDNLCLVVKYSSRHRPARISGDDLLRGSDNI